MILGHDLASRAFKIAERVVKGIEGRAADNGISLPWVAVMAGLAGPGNHCEIGSLYGASAIAAALMKKELNMPGNVICIDPFEPREGTIQPQTSAAAHFLDGSHQTLMENAKKFGLDNIIHVQQKSSPWPEELKDHVFVSGYIDGWHEGDTPYLDFISLASHGCALIGFDNYEEGYPDVMVAVEKALKDEHWIMHFKDGIFCSLRHRLPSRAKGGNVFSM